MLWMPSYRARTVAIRKLRQQKGLTQEQVWERAGVAQGTYQAMESEREFGEGRVFKLENLEAVAGALDAKPHEVAHLPKRKLIAWLRYELEKLRDWHRENDKQLHTPHLLLAMLEPPGYALHRAVASHGDVVSLLDGVRSIVRDIDASVLAYREFEWEENKYVDWALSHAWTQSRDALDNDLSLGILHLGLRPGDEGSDSVRWFRAHVGDETLAKVIAYLEDCHPPDPKTPPFSQVSNR